MGLPFDPEEQEPDHWASEIPLGRNAAESHRRSRTRCFHMRRRAGKAPSSPFVPFVPFSDEGDGSMKLVDEQPLPWRCIMDMEKMRKE